MGYSVELTCHVEAYPKPTINWVHEGIQLSTNQVSMISEFLFCQTTNIKGQLISECIFAV